MKGIESLFNRFTSMDKYIMCLVFLLLIIKKLFRGRDFGSILKSVFSEYITVFQIDREGNNSNNYYDIISMFKYLIVPLIISIGLLIKKELSPSIAEGVSVIVSIIISVLFSLLESLSNNKEKVLKNQELVEYGNLRNNLLKVIHETQKIIHFLIVLSVISLLALLLVMFTIDSGNGSGIILSFIVYYSINIVLFNIMIIVKRFADVSKVINDRTKK